MTSQSTTELMICCRFHPPEKRLPSERLLMLLPCSRHVISIDSNINNNSNNNNNNNNNNNSNKNDEALDVGGARVMQSSSSGSATRLFRSCRTLVGEIEEQNGVRQPPNSDVVVVAEPRFTGFARLGFSNPLISGRGCGCRTRWQRDWVRQPPSGLI